MQYHAIEQKVKRIAVTHGEAWALGNRAVRFGLPLNFFCFFSFFKKRKEKALKLNMTNINKTIIKTEKANIALLVWRSTITTTSSPGQYGLLAL